MFTYTSVDDVIIHVGECAKENDALTFGADPTHWWFHVADYPGAHVVARAPILSRETRRDAAVLAVKHSKAPSDLKMVVVDTCKVRDVRNTPTDGRVEITRAPTILTVFQNRVTEKARLARLHLSL